MAQIPYRANLSASVFPMTIAKSGPSVINPQADQNYDKRVDPASAPMSVGIPQAIYCENVLPSPGGYQSVKSKITGNITLDSTIYTAETIRLAVEIQESAITPDVDFEDDGTQFADWIVSPNDTVGADYRNVQVVTDEGNPQPSYRFQYSRNEHIAALMYRQVQYLSEGSAWIFSWDFKFNSPNIDSEGNPDTGFNSAHMRFLNSAVGAGLGVLVSHNSHTSAGDPAPNYSIQLILGNQWSTEYGPVLLTGITYDPLAAESIKKDYWYTNLVTVTKNPDATITIQVNITSTDDLTFDLVTLVYSGNYALGNYIGMIQETSVPTTVDFWTTWYDNIAVTADLPDVSYTTVAGITNVDIVFYENDTARWSHGNVDTFENNAVTLPVGFESPTDSDRFSTTSVRGECYVCIKNLDNSTSIYHVTYNDLGPTLVFEDVTSDISSTLGIAFNINNVVGITGSYNYLLLLTPDSVIWSSTTSVEDFAPSLESGAGSERIGNLKGDISFAKEHVAGFFLYTTGNVIFAAYTGNAAYPWKFREVQGSSGYTYSQQISGDSNTALQYGVSNAKIVQTLQPDGAQLVAEDISNYIERSNTWDQYNHGTGIFERINANESSQVLLPESGKYRVWLALDRYVLIATVCGNGDGLAEFSNALVFDILLRRYGKVNLQFNNLWINESSIFFVRYIDGKKIKLILDVDYQRAITGPDPVLLLGKFQLSRDKFVCLDTFELESADSNTDSPSFVVSIYPTYNGKIFTSKVTPVIDETRTQNEIVSYNTRVEAHNFSLAIIGTFDLVSVAMKVHQGGNR